MKLGLLGLVLIALLAAACFPTALAARQHRVRVLDAESSAPVSGATLDLHYYPSAPQAPDPNHPRAAADAQGEITIASSATPAIWQVQAPGYIEQQLAARDGALPPRYAAGAAGADDGTVHLYRLPEPQLMILVSRSYTGSLTVNLEPAPGFGFVQVDQLNVAFAAVDQQASYVQGAAGRRVFTETASAQGTVNLVVTPLLYDLTARQLQVRDEAGPLPYRDISNPGDTERGVWGTVNEDDKKLHHQIRLFVGTLAEYKAALNSNP